LRFVVLLWHRLLPVRSRLCRLGLQRDATCVLCGEEAETYHHVFCRCPALEEIRYQLRHAMDAERWAAMFTTTGVPHGAHERAAVQRGVLEWAQRMWSRRKTLLGQWAGDG
jgi:hypothetical protein